MTATTWVENAMGKLPRELVLSVVYLYEQGAHMPLIHNAAADDDRHKRPLWRGWQRPELRPTLQQNLEHLAGGGLIGLLPASIGMVVADIDEYEKDGLADWITRYPPLGDVPSLQPGRTHLYYNSSTPFHNRQQWKFMLYGISMEIRSRHGFVILWDPEAVAEIVAERSMARSTRGMTRLPRGVLGLRVSRYPWPAVAATLGLGEPPPREPRPRTPPRTSRIRMEPTPFPSPASWILPNPPAHLQEVGEGRRNTEVFDAVRYAVYRLPRGQGGEAMRIRWYELVLSQTEACNRTLPVPMRPARVVSTARSIARFTWANPYFGRTDDMGRRDAAVQRERGLASGMARRERLQPRNQRIVAMHRAGWSIAHVARQEALSWIQTWRVVAADQARPGIYHEPIAPPDAEFENLGKMSMDDEIRNGRAAISHDETLSQQPLEQSEPSIITRLTDDTTLSDGPSLTPIVDNSVGNVDNSTSPWDEAIREGEKRRVEEFRRRDERERWAWRDRGAARGVGGVNGVPRRV